MKQRRYLMNCTTRKKEKERGVDLGFQGGQSMLGEAAHLVTRGKATDTQGEQDPSTSMRGLGGVLCELFADLAVDLISQLLAQDAVADDEVQLLEVGGRALQNGHLILTRLSCIISHHLRHILEAKGEGCANTCVCTCVSVKHLQQVLLQCLTTHGNAFQLPVSRQTHSNAKQGQ